MKIAYMALSVASMMSISVAAFSAVTSSPTALTVTVEERTWRATIESPRGQDSFINLHRERRTFDAGNVEVGEKTIRPPIVIRLTEVAAETVTVGGTTLTVAQLMEFLDKYFDQKGTDTP